MDHKEDDSTLDYLKNDAVWDYLEKLDKWVYLYLVPNTEEKFRTYKLKRNKYKTLRTEIFHERLLKLYKK